MDILRAGERCGSWAKNARREVYYEDSQLLLPLAIADGAMPYPSMPKLIEHCTRIEAAGNKPKLIDEIVGRINTGTKDISIAHMRSPGGWVEPGQRPEFDEYTYVLRGELQVEREHGDPLIVKAGNLVHTAPGEWIRYSTPGNEGCEYIAICLPAFSPDTVRRDEED